MPETPEFVFTYAAQGTAIQAERLVGRFFGKPGPLLYGGVGIEQPVQHMQERFPELKKQLDEGNLGLAEDGDIDIPNTALATPELKRLVRAENRDRAFLYNAMTVAVGHDRHERWSWLAYVDATFGAEWQKQAPSGWWLRNERGEWRQKP